MSRQGSLRRVLIVSPHFPPVNAPDMQRVRMGLPYYRENGWEPVVLAMSPDLIEGAIVEPLLEQSLPGDLRIVRSSGLPASYTRWAGTGNLWLRGGRRFMQAGDALLREQPFDLAFFSTTQFSSFTLGPRWLRKFGLPYVLDYQDPWRNTYYETKRIRPPGGILKYTLSQLYALSREPRALRHASGIVAVSDSYGAMLHRLYPGIRFPEVRTLPFGASEKDFQIAARHRPEPSLITRHDDQIHIVYAGRCGPDMSLSMSALFTAFRTFLQTHPREAARIRFHFIGTDYAPPPLGREWAMPVARQLGVEAYVSEHCRRVPFYDALHYLLQADALVALGSNDATYSASKLYPYILARRPLLTLFHQASLVTSLARVLKAGLTLHFDDNASIAKLAESIHRDWFASGDYLNYRPHNEEAFEGLHARQATAALCRHFDEVLRHATPKTRTTNG